jgi:hypothetical protein
MSLTIKPGYDFKATETPTREKFLRAARGLDIKGIDSSNLAADLIAHSFTTSSGVTLPAEGWLWTDGGGNSWVQTANGAVRWGRLEGGWESRRFTYADAVEAQGNKVDFSGGAEEASVTIKRDTARVDDGGVYSMIAHETCVSGANPVLVGRGGVILSAAIDTQYYWPIKTLLRTYGADGLNWALPVNYTPGSTYKAFPASVLGHSFPSALGYMWFHGRNLYGPGASL